MREKWTRSGIAATAAAAVVLMVPTGAVAGYGGYFSGELGHNDRAAGPSRSDLETSTAHAGYNKTATTGAHNPGGWDLSYHGYKQATEFVCKYYGGPGHNLGGLVKNVETFPVLTMAGESYGSHSLCNW